MYTAGRHSSHPSEPTVPVISHPHRALFFHVGKTAGSSIEAMFVPAHPDPMVSDRALLYGLDKQLNIYLQHASCATVIKLIGEETFDEYFKFTIVRNPFSRIYSVYHYSIGYYSNLYGSFNGFLRQLPRLSVDRWQLPGSHLISQIHYTHLSGRQVVDYIGKFEEIATVADYLNARLSMFAPLARQLVPLRATEQLKYCELFDDEAISIMRSVYRQDFDIFGYADAPV